LFGSANPPVSPGSIIQVGYVGEESKLETIEVKGEVVKPAVIQHFKGATLGFYLTLCGGFTKDADAGKIAIHLPDGELLVKKENEEFNPVIRPGSIIIIQAKAGAEDWREKTPTDPAAVPPIKTGGEEQAKTEIIDVRGAIVHPAGVPYILDAKLGYYLAACGGLTDDADAENIVVQNPDGSLIVKQANVPFNPVIPRGSIIIVNKKTGAAGR
jgi:hypothetical protein